MRQKSYDPRNRRIDALTDIAQQQHGYGAGLTGVLAQMLGAYGAKRQQKKLDDKYEGEELQQRDALAQALKDEQEHQIPGEVDPMAVTLAGQSVPGLQGMANPMVAQLLSAGRDVERADLGAKNDAIRAENSNKADLRALVDAGVDRSAILGIRENRRADDLRYKRGLEGEDRALGQAKELAEFKSGLTDNRAGLPQGWEYGQDGQARMIPGTESYHAGKGQVTQIGPDGSVYIGPPGGQKVSKGQNAVDKAGATPLSEWVLGGQTDFAKGLVQLRGARDLLQTEQGITGIHNLLPDGVRTVFAPEGVKVEEMVAEVAQRNLRLILGGQFAQQEGEQLIKRAYNPALPQEENIRRLDALIAQMESAAAVKDAAARHLDQYGTLQGFTQKLPTFDDFAAAISDTQSMKPGDVMETLPDDAVSIGGNRYRLRDGTIIEAE